MKQSDLHKLFRYEPSTGWLIRRISTNARAMKGSIAGTLNGAGYLHMQIEGSMYLVHRLVWMLHVGTLPPILDHINRIKTDNRIENLRIADQTQNNVNRGITKGCSQRPCGSWYAQTKLKGKTVYLGTHPTEEKANTAYNKFMKEAHGEFFNP